MKAKLLIPCDRVRYFNGRDASGGWDTYPGNPGDILDDSRCWELCGIRDISPLSPTFGKLYAEPADEECAAMVAPYREAERLEVLNRSGMTDIEADFRERFKIRDEEVEAKEAATAEFEAKLMEGV